MQRAVSITASMPPDATSAYRRRHLPPALAGPAGQETLCRLQRDLELWPPSLGSRDASPEMPIVYVQNECSCLPQNEQPSPHHKRGAKSDRSNLLAGDVSAECPEPLLVTRRETDPNVGGQAPQIHATQKVPAEVV